jgi:hypothetical protein
MQQQRRTRRDPMRYVEMEGRGVGSNVAQDWEHAASQVLYGSAPAAPNNPMYRRI